MKQDGLTRVGQCLVQGVACRKAARQIRYYDAVRVLGIASLNCNWISHRLKPHLRPACLRIAALACALLSRSVRLAPPKDQAAFRMLSLTRRPAATTMFTRASSLNMSILPRIKSETRGWVTPKSL